MVSRDDATIFDVGAHFGAVSKIYQSLFPSATLHAFEPSPEAFDLFQRNSDGDQRHHAHRIALSDNNGIAEFSLNHASATNSLLPTDKNAPENWKSFVETENRVAVPTQTLDSFCKQHHLDRVDILKLDVQGAEGKVLAGASDLFQRQAIKAVYLEMIVASTYVGQSRPAEICRPYGPRPHRRRWSSRPSPGERWPSRLVATAAEDRRRGRMPNAKSIGWAIYSAGFVIWLFGYLSVGHAPAFDWVAATPWWISSFVPNLEAELGIALMFASMVPIYW